MVSSSSIPSAQRLEPALPGFFQLSSLHELREDVCHFLWPAAPWWITSEQLSKARLPLGQEHGCVSCGPHNRRSGHVCLCCSQHLPTCESAAGMDQIWYWSVKDMVPLALDQDFFFSVQPRTSGASIQNKRNIGKFFYRLYSVREQAGMCEVTWIVL